MVLLFYCFFKYPATTRIYMSIHTLSLHDACRICWRMCGDVGDELCSQPDLLLLDEPTNHLDLEATLWLESFLKNYPRTVLLVSHDRDLLNKVVDKIVH